LHALKQADHEVLCDLLLRSHKAERVLMSQEWAWRARRWVKPALAGLAVLVLVIVAALSWHAVGVPVLERLHEWWVVAWFTARRVNGFELWLGAGAVLVAFLVY